MCALSQLNSLETCLYFIPISSVKLVSVECFTVVKYKHTKHSSIATISCAHFSDVYWPIKFAEKKVCQLRMVAVALYYYRRSATTIT